MKNIVPFILLGLIIAYAYYDEGIGQYQKNLFRVAYSNIGVENSNSLAASRKIISSNADVVFVANWTGENLDPIEILSSGYKVVNNSAEKGPHGIVFFAKNSINITSMLVKNPISGPCARPIITASLQYNNTLLTILGVYAPAPVEACLYKTDSTVTYFSTLVQNGKLSRDIGVGKKGDDVIMVGDLNSLPFNSTIKEIKHSGLIDAHERAGQYLGATWSPFYGSPSLARIDYLFISPDLDIKRLWNSRMPGSRHNLLVADFTLP